MFFSTGKRSTVQPDASQWCDDKLEYIVLPRFCQQRDQSIRIMRQAIALNAAHFNTQRMVQEYIVKAYFR